MSSPLPISYIEHGASVTPGASGGILGSSPRSQHSPATAARKFYKRLLYDATVDASQFSVSVILPLPVNCLKYTIWYLDDLMEHVWLCLTPE